MENCTNFKMADFSLHLIKVFNQSVAEPHGRYSNRIFLRGPYMQYICIEILFQVYKKTYVNVMQNLYLTGRIAFIVYQNLRLNYNYES